MSSELKLLEKMQNIGSAKSPAYRKRIKGGVYHFFEKKKFF